MTHDDHTAHATEILRLVEQAADRLMLNHVAAAIEAAYARGFAEGGGRVINDPKAVEDVERLLLAAASGCTTAATLALHREDPSIAEVHRLRMISAALRALVDVLHGREPEGAVVIMGDLRG